jgi:hypothetical protein
MHNEKLHNLYPSPNIIRTNKSRRMKWAGYLARMWRKIIVEDLSDNARSKEITRKT